MKCRWMILSALLGLLGLSAEALAQQRERGCGHGPQNSCNQRRYPPEQLSAPGWCESHFIIDKKGEKRHECPKPWPTKSKAQPPRPS